MSAEGKKIYGLIGYPVKHSLSPLMQMAAFRELGIAAEYKLFTVEPEKLEEFLLEVVFRENISGLNITIPHKVRAREILEKNFPAQKKASRMLINLYYVKLSGAINTVRRVGDKLEYFNTDASGFLRSLDEDLKFNIKNKNVMLMGCGGAGRAVIAALSWRNLNVRKIYIYDINQKSINAAKNYFLNLDQPRLTKKLEFISSFKIAKVIKDCHLLVNATGVGMKESDPCLIQEDLLHPGLLVYDLIYNPAQTKLLKVAQAKGCRVYNGLGMLLYQGIEAFELWTNKRAPVEVMRQALNKGVKQLCLLK